jgi:hypothetical protein
VTDPLSLYKGTKFEIRCLVLADDSSPAFEFWTGLTELEQQQLMVWFVHLCDSGRISNDTRFKKVEGTNVFEFKNFQIRMFCFLHCGVVYLTDGLRKKQDRHKRQDVKRAESYRSWFLEQAQS